MSQPPLKPLEIEDLLNQYRSDLRKLKYQIHKTQTVIQELERQAAEAQEALALESAKALPSAEEAKAAPPEKKSSKPKAPRKRRGRPPKAKSTPSQEAAAGEGAKAEAPSAPKKKRGPGRPRKSESKKKSTKATKAKKDTAGKEGTGSSSRLSDWDEFVVKSLQSKQQALITKDFLAIAKSNPDIKSGEAQIKVKLNRSLHKLSNKKGVLVKVEHPGRGYAYALSEWLNSKEELPKKYARQ